MITKELLEKVLDDARAETAREMYPGWGWMEWDWEVVGEDSVFKDRFCELAAQKLNNRVEEILENEEGEVVFPGPVTLRRNVPIKIGKVIERPTFQLDPDDIY